ncbi:hypothetical protein ANICBIBUN_11390, partial [Acinetobacter nosocomialis 28F]
MIKNIKLKFGRAPDLEQMIVNALPITVFVGPNNSGKSQILREIHQFCISGNQNTNNKIIDNIELEAVSEVNVNNIRPLAKVVIASSSDLPVQRLS